MMESSLRSSPPHSTLKRKDADSLQDDNTTATIKNPFIFSTYFPHRKRETLPDYGFSKASSLSYPTFLTPSFANEQKNETKPTSFSRRPSINQQFEDVLGSLDQIKNSISALETCILQLDDKSNTLSTRMEQLDQKNHALSTCMKELDLKYSDLGASIEQLNHKCDTLGTYMEELNRKCNALGTSMDQLNDKINAPSTCIQQVDNKTLTTDDTLMQELRELRETNQSTGSIIAQETVRVIDKAMKDWIQKIYNRIDVRVSQYEILTRCMIQRRQPPCPQCSRIPNNEHDRLPYSYRLITRGSLIQPNTEL